MNRTTEEILLVSAIDPDNQSANTVTGDWVKADEYDQYLAVFNVGVMTSTGTCIFSVQQATDGSGSGAKAVKTATTLTEAGTDSDKQVLMSIKDSDLDLAGGFLWIAPRAVTAVAASYVCANLFGVTPKYGFNVSDDLSSVDEIL